jgi:hypothetical protein
MILIMVVCLFINLITAYTFFVSFEILHFVTSTAMDTYICVRYIIARIRAHLLHNFSRKRCIVKII